MKKIIRWIVISFSIVIFLSLSVASFAVWIVFTPEKLTPIVRKQAANYLTCKSVIGNVELTFFSTFPRFGLKLSNFALINPVVNGTSDTLVRAEKLIGVVDVGAWWKHNEIIVNELQLQNGTVNAFIDTVGHTNFDITPHDTMTSKSIDSTKSKPLGLIDIKNVELKNISVSYVDLKGKLQAAVHNLSAQFSGSNTADSLACRFKLNNALVSFSNDGKDILNKVAITCDIPIKMNLSRQLIFLNKGELSVNNLGIVVSGTIENDTIHKQILTNIHYSLKSWSISEIVALVPPSFQSYLKGVKIEGAISSEGKITGAYTNTTMPLMNIHLQLHNVSLKYDSFPLPLSQVNGDLVFYSDLKNNAISYFQINQFSAKTPKSSFKTTGTVRNLFSDITCDLTTDADLGMDEFKPLIPTNLKLTVKGKVAGHIKSSFTLSQVQKMLLDKMKVSGSINLTDFEAIYDTIKLSTNVTNIDFALPNPNASSQNKYFWAKINSKDLETTIALSTYAKLKNSRIVVETSNFMDTTKLPNVLSSFSMDSLCAGKDTLKLSIQKPMGDMSISSQKGSKAIPSIKLNYRSHQMESCMGHNTLALNSINLKADINNDPSQKDIYRQWIAKGFFDLDKAVITLSSIPKPIEIPSIKIDFDPENFNIKESRLKIDKSDFSLSGKLSNVLSYLRNDSLLRADFSFFSNNTDLLQLMALTNGLGETPAKDTTRKVATIGKDPQPAAASGPYMVPKGIDFNLRTNIHKATFGADTITNIDGNVRVKDGILILDGLVLTTPATKIQLTAMYRTPRKNHLYLGIDYHMLDIEIEALVKMVPGIDSMMPMLSAFKGKGEFHIAAETYLDSLYNVKKSTIRAASSIRGRDLVLMDGPTFTEISKVLKFNKKTKNKIDSLSVEFTVFKDEIDIYPFLIGIDDYQAVVSGRHNLDMSFDYNISLVNSPVPVKLGAEVSGNMDKLKYRLAKSKFPEFYRPEARGIVQDKQLQLRKMIRDALVQKVKVQTKV